MPPYDGKIKLAFCKRLGRDWQDLADYFEIKSSERAGFGSGNEPREVWEWLERRNRLTKLPDGLRHIDREDIVVEVLEPPPTPAAPLSQPIWTGSPFPGLRRFNPKDAPIFFGRFRQPFSPFKVFQDIGK